VVHYGEEGYDRVLAMADDQGEAWLKAHEHRADQLAWTLYVLAGIAAVAILAPFKWPKAGTGLAILTLALSLVVLGISGYIAQAGAKFVTANFEANRRLLSRLNRMRIRTQLIPNLLLLNAAKP
jgi:hypothetical protein